MTRERITPTWRNPFAGLIGRDRVAPPPSAMRRLRGERLEDRMVLSTAPVPVDVSQGQSLEGYLTQDHPMGPTLPAEVASATAPEAATASAPEADLQRLAATISPTSIDQWFGVGYGEGAGEGEGSGSGSGAGSGSGSGAGSGSGSGSASPDPGMTTTDVETSDGNIRITGYLTDDGGAGNLSLSIDGADGSVSVDSDGNFTVSITDTGGNQTFTITITDGDGNSTTYTFSF
jgi:hypothetical protein